MVSDGQALARIDDESAALIFLAPDQAPDGTSFLLGQDDADGTVYFGVSGPLPPALDGTRPAALREVGTLLGDRDAGLLTHAVALANWHASIPTARATAPPRWSVAAAFHRCPGRHRALPAYRPRGDHAGHRRPDDRILLAGTPPGRAAGSPSWPGSSTRASPLEQAVRREVPEETEIKVTTSLRRQPALAVPAQPDARLPADAPAGQHIVLDREEIAEARWFSRDELVAAIRAREIALPPPVSIARQIIEHWYGAPLPSTWSDRR